MSLYRNIFKKAWSVSWSQKYLWFFGIFAALLGGGGSEILLQSSSEQTGFAFTNGWKMYVESGIFSWQTVANIGMLLRTDFWATFYLLSFFAIIVASFAFFVWLAIVSQAAIVDGAAASFSRRKTNNTIQGGVAVGNKNFWPVFGLNIITKIVLLFILVIISQLLLISIVLSSPLSNGLLILLFVVLFALAAFFSLIMKYAIASVVVKGEKIISAIKFGWNLFVKNWIVSVEMSLLLFFITLVAALAIVLAVFILIIPFAFLAFIFFKIFSLSGFLLIFFLAFLVLLVFIILSGSLLTIFTTSSWTGLFIELSDKGGVSKIVRMAQELKK